MGLLNKLIFFKDKKSIRLELNEKDILITLDKQYYNYKIICFQIYDVLSEEFLYLSFMLNNDKLFLSKDTYINFDEECNNKEIFTDENYEKYYSTFIENETIFINILKDFFKFNLSFENKIVNIEMFEKNKYNNIVKIDEDLERKFGLLSIQDYYFNN